MGKKDHVVSAEGLAPWLQTCPGRGLAGVQVSPEPHTCSRECRARLGGSSGSRSQQGRAGWFSSWPQPSTRWGLPGSQPLFPVLSQLLRAPHPSTSTWTALLLGRPQLATTPPPRDRSQAVSAVPVPTNPGWALLTPTPVPMPDPPAP